MSFDELLDRVWYCDCECYSHDSLFVFISHKDHTKYVFHNSIPDDIQTFIDENNPILIGYNINGYDKYILKAWLSGYTPEELYKASNFIINGGNGWEIDCGYIKIPTCWDLMQCIKTFKSLKELEGNMRINIVETSVPFDLPTKWTKEQYEEVLKYCTWDVESLIPMFKKLLKRYKAKYIVCKFGNIDYEKGLSMTDANLTAALLGGERKEHDDPFGYTYPDCIDKLKIPRQVLEYIDDLIEHNDLEYKREAPTVVIQNMEAQLGVGGIHGFLKDGTLYYDRGDKLGCD